MNLDVGMCYWCRDMGSTVEKAWYLHGTESYEHWNLSMKADETEKAKWVTAIKYMFYGFDCFIGNCKEDELRMPTTDRIS